MEKYYNQYTIPYRKELKERELLNKKIEEYIELQLKPQLEELKSQINNCNNKVWNMDFYINNSGHYCSITLSLLDYWRSNIKPYIGDKKDFEIKNVITKEMNRLYELGIKGRDKDMPIFYSDIRIMEER